MSLSIVLNPLSTTLAMHGTAHTTCSYSLSGTVNLTVSPTKSFFPLGTKPKAPEIILTSLVVTFEGKAEYERPGESYSGIRLCTVSEEVVKSPIVLKPNSPVDENNNQSHYAMIFDLLTIPGWLPATLRATDREKHSAALTSYSLFATATYRLKEPTASSSPLSCGSVFSLCAPLWPRTRKAHASRVEIRIERHFVSNPPPRSLSDNHLSLFPNTSYAVSAHSKESSPIPDEIISKLSILASIPSITATSESTLPISLKARYESGPGEMLIERIDVDIEQNETFLSEPDNTYTSQFPITSAQPPVVPLLHRSPAEALNGMGCIFGDTPLTWVKNTSILEKGATSRFYLDPQEDEVVVASQQPKQDGYRLGSEWCKIDMETSFLHYGLNRNSSKPITLLPKFCSPFLHVDHVLRLSVHVLCSGDKRDVIEFTLPLNFVVLPPHAQTPVSTRASSPATVAEDTPISLSTPSSSLSRFQDVPSSSASYGYSYAPMSLPAYTQLFHDDGEARIDPFRGVPPAYRDKLDSQDEGMKVNKPEFVPVGTQSIELDRVEWLID